ncbi:hypothetical protein AYI69_g4622 [Smittium culicis]|uniref:t-SNARE coiled-coil homology domain-containing protein n=1 Tax=Smittium culicis TaxID=133412 RepID=A0A1R1YC68_9FUNG|nr:hypothetical protein AYI69_g9500 [Smittium culicis]OMJ24470.1 hypothetical protein AYI69_g4622 [Smittium culicis]
MKYNARIERQIKVINPAATNEEIRAAVRDGSAKNIFMESGFVSEKTELNSLFSEMQGMVVHQQKMLDNIEQVVQSTDVYTVRANEEMDTAITIRRSTRKIF